MNERAEELIESMGRTVDGWTKVLGDELINR